jgi:TrmH family RNA methyltransferase
MVEKSKKKLISSLSQKKHRDKYGLFVAEGVKLVNDLLTSGMTSEIILGTNFGLVSKKRFQSKIEIVDDSELRKISSLKTPQSLLAVFKKPECKFKIGDHAERLTLCLDGIQDPGNMGTIIRLADWFGINTVVCSYDTADAFNPKVVQASMGALARVEVYYTKLDNFCKQSAEQYKLQIFGTFMDGENIYTTKLPKKGLIIMGNEGKGIRPAIEKEVTKKLTIPCFPRNRKEEGMESLNVGVAAAIVCSEFRRPTCS